MDMTFTLADLLTLIGLLTGLVTIWIALTTRVAKLETKAESMLKSEDIIERFTKLESDIHHLSGDMKEKQQSLESFQSDISKKIDDLSEVITDLRLAVSKINVSSDS